jgi:hypothetical protein
MNLLILACVIMGILIGILLSVLVAKYAQKQSLPPEPDSKRIIVALISLVPLVFIVTFGSMINSFSSAKFYGVSGSLALYLASIFSIPMGFLWVKIYRQHGGTSSQNFAIDALAQGMASGHNIINRKAEKSDFISFTATFFIIVGTWFLVMVFALTILGKFL